MTEIRDRIKARLKKYPRLYVSLRSIYHRIKGRIIDRSIGGMAKQLVKVIFKMPGRLVKVIFNLLDRTINIACYGIYRLRHITARHNRVRSVLQLSIISHKQYMLSRVMRAHGIKSDFFALNYDIARNLNIGFDYGVPYHIAPFRRRLLEIYYLWNVMARYDVIHSHFLTFLTQEGREFYYLKKLGKVIVFHFRGCDLRQKSINLEKNPELNCCQECDYAEGSCDTDYQRHRLSLARKYGDYFFVTTPDLRDFLPEAEHLPFIYPYGIDFDKIQPSPKNTGVFRVVTSSNHHGVDGTAYIRTAVQRLGEEGWQIELIEVSDMPYLEALAVYKSADIYIGKLRMGYYNNANIETMLVGVPNMSYIRPEFLKAIPDCPILITTPDTVYNNLKEYIGQPEKLKEIGSRGPDFIRKYHDPDKIIDHLIKRYNEVFLCKKKGLDVKIHESNIARADK